MLSSLGRAAFVTIGYLQLVTVVDRSPAALPPHPPSSSSSALVEYTPPVAKPEDEDLEIKLRRIIEWVPIRVSNTSGSFASFSSGDFHQVLSFELKSSRNLILKIRSIIVFLLDDFADTSFCFLD
ncbi:hypothetical protein PHJA_002516400 [Phtheirospermum japonicum]|uniref:Uncharacterized protein n=1 Tax=Phtheirospermum japonicum TaxID=374723 RepID=A0A830D9B4_9LAMI|nr:hypothetical protein PHJA_002516400 [Phtheirospermum japonicum]